MAEPVDVIRAFHNAFRNDLKRIDAAAFDAAKGKAGLGGTIERFRFFNEMLVWHAKGEEAAVFPRIDTVAPLVAEAYLLDHHGRPYQVPEKCGELNWMGLAESTKKLSIKTEDCSSGLKNMIDGNMKVTVLFALQRCFSHESETCC